MANRLVGAAAGPLKALASSRVLRPILLGATRSGVLPKPLWKLMPVEHEFTVRLGREARFRYRARAGDFMGQVLYWRGGLGYEAETIRVFMPLARAARLFVDVGANTGFYTLAALALNRQLAAVAYEPVPETAAALRDNIGVNGMDARASVVQAAAAETTGVVPFHVPRLPFPGSASLHREGFHGLAGRLIDVVAETLDERFTAGPAPDLIKIDAENAEDRVLAGMRRILGALPVLIVECNPDGPHQAVEAALTPHAYRFFHLDGAGPRVAQSIVPRAGKYRNWLCLPPGRDLPGAG